MKYRLLGAAALATMAIASPAQAVVLIADGITYELNETGVSADGKTATFTLEIAGINSASDTEGGRTGINAIAFTDPSTGTAISGNLAGFLFQNGGLNSGGCDGNGNFFCFDNTSIPPTPGTLLGDFLSLTFTVTADDPNAWADYLLTSFKIDWVGNKNNYDLVSREIGINRCLTGNCPTINPLGLTPEPATWIEMIFGFGVIGWVMRRKDRKFAQRVRLA